MDLPVIHNWTILWNSVLGTIYNSEKFPSGKGIRTSKIISIDRENRILKTKNSTYLLGKEY